MDNSSQYQQISTAGFFKNSDRNFGRKSRWLCLISRHFGSEYLYFILHLPQLWNSIPNYIFSEQDGGIGKPGKVLEVQDWDKTSVRSVANVSWTTTGITNVYRIGHKGKVDVHCLQPASGGNYYFDHLPVPGKQLHVGVSMPKNPVALNTKPNDFRIGERVRIGKFTNQQLESMQEQHGGFNPKMLEVLNLVGEVHRLTSNGDVRVQYPGDPATSFRWTVSYDTHILKYNSVCCFM